MIWGPFGVFLDRFRTDFENSKICKSRIVKKQLSSGGSSSSRSSNTKKSKKARTNKKKLGRIRDGLGVILGRFGGIFGTVSDRL